MARRRRRSLRCVHERTKGVAQVAEATTAIVTGASRGLGAGAGPDLAAAGWNLVVDARGAAALARAADQVDAAGPGTVVALPGDIADPVATWPPWSAPPPAQGGLDLLVNNAGTLGPSPLPHVADCAPATWNAILAPTWWPRCG